MDTYIYKKRLESKKEIGEIGERFVDLSSSYHKVPINFSFILEYETLPYWSAIIYDFRKLLSVLAPVKVGVFHLPKWFSTSKLWIQDEKTGRIEREGESKVLDSSKPDELIEEMKNELRSNELEHLNTVYLIILIHSPTEKDVNIHGYLLWRETTGEVHSENISALETITMQTKHKVRRQTLTVRATSQSNPPDTTTQERVARSLPLCRRSQIPRI